MIVNETDIKRSQIDVDISNYRLYVDFENEH